VDFPTGANTIVSVGFDAATLRAIREALSRAATERRRAHHAALIAARHVRQAATGSPAMAEFHTGMAALHRRTSERHSATARAHLAYAARIRRTGGLQNHDTMALYMAGVADSVHAEGASVMYLENHFGRALRIGSDATAKAAQDLETIVGEGPSLEAFAHAEAVVADGFDLARRWPLYGPAAARLGVTGVVALPVPAGQGRVLGALTLYEPREPVGPRAMARLRAAADSMTALLLSEELGSPDEVAPPLWRRVYADQLAVIHQAAGILAVRHGCGVEDALAMIGARAFTEGIPAEDVAAAILSERLRADGHGRMPDSEA